MIKKSLIASFVVMIFIAAGCSGGKKVTSEAIISSVVTAMCKKMAECQPKAMPSEDFCQNTMKAALSGNKDLPKVETTQKKLDGCVASIQKSDCDGLLGSKPPSGCEFLQ